MRAIFFMGHAESPGMHDANTSWHFDTSESINASKELLAVLPVLTVDIDLRRLRDLGPSFSGLVCIGWEGCARAGALSRCARASERRFRQTRPNSSEWFTRPY